MDFVEEHKLNSYTLKVKQFKKTKMKQNNALLFVLLTYISNVRHDNKTRMHKSVFSKQRSENM